MKKSKKELLRSLPSVSTLLEHEDVVDWLSGVSRNTVVDALRTAVDGARESITSGNEAAPVDIEDLLATAEADIVRRTLPSLCRVVNATGIVLHTGLGRAPLCEAAIDAIVDSASGYCNLEYDLDTGSRGRRNTHVVEKIKAATGAEAATVVNNNAAATLLILQTFSAGRETIVSRGQLVEIGGSFRLPDIMQASGARLREVGTTNRTHLRDYESAICDDTAVLLHVHTSNYRVVGFTHAVDVGQIATLAHERDLIAVDDLGSGAMLGVAGLGAGSEPSIQESIAAGADIVCFSGDKLLGGPQAGIIVGREELIRRIESNPLMRTYRVGKLTLAALEATLSCYVDSDEAQRSVPTLAMLAATTEGLAPRARSLCDLLNSALPDEKFLVCSSVSYAGGGSMPQLELQSVAVQWRPSTMSVDAAASTLREADVPVIASIHEDALWFDLRTVDDSDFEHLVTSITSAVWDATGADDSDGACPASSS